MENQHNPDNTIAAISTPPGVGGIAVIRISGDDAIKITEKIWRGKSPSEWLSHTAHLGSIVTPQGETIDNAVATVFHAPNSFTGENVVELSIHGSRWIQQQVMNLLTENGAQPAGRGEFTQRAFMNGRLDLAQAESIADLIAADSKAAHRLAMTQLKGTYSNRLKDLRNQLIEIASLMELELDFSEEDVEFADRKQLIEITSEIENEVNKLAKSFRAGKVFKEGIPVVIAGVPNAGKSTLLNALVDDEKAIVTDIPGTTRDIIEETVELDGILFRIFDTAGLRTTSDEVERIGVERTRKKVRESHILLWIEDPTQPLQPQQNELTNTLSLLPPDTTILHITSKNDLSTTPGNPSSCTNSPERQTSEDRETAELPVMCHLQISAKTGSGIDTLKSTLVTQATKGLDMSTDLMVTNARHYDSLTKAHTSILRIRDGLENGLSGDFIAQDIRETMHHLSSITGEITTDTLLSTIFSRFCIGK